MALGRRERFDNPEEIHRLAFNAMQSRLWTAVPGIVDSFNAAQMTVEVQPTTNGAFPLMDGTFKTIQMPKLLDCPVMWQGGGGATFTFPIAKGDECLVVFASRCIDGWWKTGTVCDPPEYRMHSLSDGFALVGLRSLAKAFAVDTSKVMLRSNDGTTYLKMDPVAGSMQMTAPGGITLNGVTINSSGNVVTSGNVTSAGKVLATHTHSGVTAGAAASGPPV